MCGRYCCTTGVQAQLLDRKLCAMVSQGQLCDHSAHQGSGRLGRPLLWAHSKVQPQPGQSAQRPAIMPACLPCACQLTMHFAVGVELCHKQSPVYAALHNYVPVNLIPIFMLLSLDLWLLLTHWQVSVLAGLLACPTCSMYCGSHTFCQVACCKFPTRSENKFGVSRSVDAPICPRLLLMLFLRHLGGLCIAVLMQIAIRASCCCPTFSSLPCSRSARQLSGIMACDHM